MIAGNIILEDISIQFRLDYDENEGHTVFYSLFDTHSGTHEFLRKPASKFFKALAIAVHMDGEPNSEKDYPDAESIMGKIRWIP